MLQGPMPSPTCAFSDRDPSTKIHVFCCFVSGDFTSQPYFWHHESSEVLTVSTVYYSGFAVISERVGGGVYVSERCLADHQPT